MNIRYQLEKLRLLLSGPFTKNYTANICSHSTKARGFIHYFGREDIMRNKFEENGRPNYCFDCLAKMTTQCAWCGKPITVGDPISVDTLCDPKHEILDYASKYKGGYVGCLRTSCSDGIMDRNGFWMPPGEVMRVPSVIESIIANNGKAIVIHNVRDPNDHGTIL